MYIGGRRSTTGYIFFIGDAPISWRSRKQQRLATSSTEAEIIAQGEATREAMWLSNLIPSIQRNFIISKEGVRIYQDNTSAVKHVEKGVLTERTKHFGLSYFFITEAVKNKAIHLEDINTELMVADTLTKALAQKLFEKHLQKIMSLEEGPLKGSHFTEKKVHSYFSKGVCWNMIKDIYNHVTSDKVRETNIMLC